MRMARPAPASTAAASGPAGSAAFEVLPFAVSEYLDVKRNLVTLEIEEDTAEICRQLARLGGTTSPWDVAAAERDMSAVTDRLDVWSNDTAPRDSAFVWVGHGGSSGSDAYLWVRGRSGADHRLKHGSLAGFVGDQGRRRRAWEAQPPHWTIVLIQACGAAGVARRMHGLIRSESRNAGEGLLIVACGKELGTAYPRQLPQALKNAIDALTDNTTVVSLRDLAAGLEDALNGIGKVYGDNLGQAREIRRASRLPDPVAAPWNAYQELETSLDRMGSDELQHLARAGTGTRLGELAWRFVGRTEERRQVAEWLVARPAGLLVITGPVGVGKSALLGNLDVHSRPAVRDWLAGAGLIETDPKLPVPAADVSLTLAGATVRDVLGRLVESLGLQVTTPPTVDAVVDAIRSQRTEPVTVLADALDLARERPDLVELLRRLVSGAPVRVILATRSWDGPNDPELAAAERQIPLRRETRAIETYVRQGLMDVTDPFHDEPLRSRVAEIVAAGDRQFLYASLALHEILADPSVLEPEQVGRLTELLSGEEPELFRAALDRTAVKVPQVRAALAALALAEGRGLPRGDRIWSTAAQALATVTGDPAVREADLDDVLRAAAPYILVDAEDGVAVYRLAHPTLSPLVLPTEPDVLAEARLELVRQLVRLAGASLPNVTPYLYRHLPIHAAGAGPGGWQELADQPDVLDALDPQVVAAQVVRTPDHSALSLVVVGAAATGHLPGNLARRPSGQGSGGGPLASRTMYRRLGELQVRPREEPGAIEPPDGEQVFPRWTSGPRQLPTVIVDVGPAPVSALDLFEGPEGRELLVTGDTQGRVRTWEPYTGRAPLFEATGRRGFRRNWAVRSVAVGQFADGRRLVAAADQGRRVRLWQVGVGQELHTHQSGSDVQAVHLLSAGDGMPVLVTVCFDGRLEFRPVHGHGAGPPVGATTTTGSVAASAPVRRTADPVRHRLVLVSRRGRLEVFTAAGERTASDETGLAPVERLSALEDGDRMTLAVWTHGLVVGQLGGPWRTLDLAAAGLPRSDRSGPVDVLVGLLPFPDEEPAVAAAVGRHLLVGRGDDVRELPGHGSRVTALTTTAGSAGPGLLITGAQDGTARLAPALTVFRDQPDDRPVTAAVSLAAVGTADEPTLVIGGPEGQVSAVLLDTGSPVWRDGPGGGPVQAIWPLPALPGPGGTLVTAGLLVARPTGISRYDVGTGARTELPVVPPLPEILAMAVAPDPDGRPQVVVLDPTGTLRRLDLDTGETMVHRIEQPGHWTLLAPAEAGPAGPSVLIGGTTGLLRWRPGEAMRVESVDGPVTGLAAITDGTQPVGAVWAQDGVVKARLRGEPSAIVVTKHGRRVTTLAAVAPPSGPGLVASADEAGGILVAGLTGELPPSSVELGHEVRALALHGDILAVADLITGVTALTIDRTALTSVSPEVS